jgi:hypothetical protein
MITAAAGLCPATQISRHQQDDQDDENDPAEAATDRRATKVKTAAAEQQQQNYQQNNQIHNAPLSGFRQAVGSSTTGLDDSG